MNAPPAARSFTRLAIAIVIAAVIISAGALSYASFESTVTKTTTFTQVGTSMVTSTTVTTSLSQQTSGSGYPPVVYQVIRTNLTLQGQAAVVPCTGFNEANCPSPANATLNPVDLITYGGTYYYLYNQTESTSSSTTAAYMTWFTNSSVVCISPAHPLTNTEHQNPTCPAGPYQPNVVAIPVTSTTTVNSSLGLRLDLNLSSQSPGSITVAIDLFNAVDHLNNLTADNLWPSGAGNLYLWVQGGCGPPTDLPFGYAIFQGNLSKNDIATSVPLTLEAQPGGLFCPYEAPTPFFAFYPLSDVATTYQWGNIPSLAGNYNVTTSTTCTQAHGSDCWWNGLGTWSGYWTGSTQQAGADEVFGGTCSSGQTSSSLSTDCPLTFNQFSPGVYTVVAADEWGQVTVLHFVASS
jgi:hypothetical protein